MRLSSQGRTAFAPRFYEIKERDLTLCACQVKDEQLSLHASMKLKNAISHYALVSSTANNSDGARLKSVKDEQLPLSGIRPGNDIQRDNINRKVESKLTRSIWISRRSCYA